MAPGIYPILYAFYGEDGTLNRDAMHAQVNACIDRLPASPCWGSSRGCRAQRATRPSSNGLRKILPAACHWRHGDTPEPLSLSKRAVDVGANWLILQPPKASQAAGSHGFFGRVMDGVEVPVGIKITGSAWCGTHPPKWANYMHPNFTVMKGERHVFQFRQFIDASEGGIYILNGRGGIELVDNLRAGCAGIIPAPDCADVQIAMYNAYAQGDHARAERLYELTLPYVIFVMQSVDFALTYGKQLTARRLGITGRASATSANSRGRV